MEWPLSEKVYYDQRERDDRARKKYETLRDKYLLDSGALPDLEAAGARMDNYALSSSQRACLPISRQFYCANEFPKCQSTEVTESKLCKFVCDLWLDRCPDVSATATPF